MIALNFYVPCNLGSTPYQEHHRVYRDNVELAKFAAEHCGITTFDIPEHHFVNMLNVPGPFVMSAHLAAQVPRAKVRTTIAPIPLHGNLLRFAGEAALTDVLTEGRVEIGLARGSLDYEARRLGGSLERGREQLQEGALLLTRLFRELDVVHDGGLYQIPEPTTIMPRPYLERPIPIWIGAASQGSIEWAASHGFSVITTSLREPVELLRKQASWFRAAADTLDPSADRPRLDVLTQVFVTEDEGEVQRIREIMVDKQVKSRRGLLSGRPQRFVGGRMVLDPSVLAAANDDATALSVEDIEESVVIGPPEEVVEALQLREQLGYNGVSLDFFYHDPDVEAVGRSLELFRDKVLPALASSETGVTGPAQR